MSYFMVPLGLHQASRKTQLTINTFSRGIPRPLAGGNPDTEIWIIDYETRRRKRGTVVLGR